MAERMKRDLQKKWLKSFLLWVLMVFTGMGLFMATTDGAGGIAEALGDGHEYTSAALPSFYPGELLEFDPGNVLLKSEPEDFHLAEQFLAITEGSNEYFDCEFPQSTEFQYVPIIHRAARQYNVDPAMVMAIILAESGYNPRAVSNKGAMGLMQLMPVTARELGVENSFNPEQNIDAGVRYFSGLLNRVGGDVELALAAYNAGLGRVQEYNGVPPYKATRFYIRKVLKFHRVYSKQVTLGNDAALSPQCRISS